MFGTRMNVAPYALGRVGEENSCCARCLVQLVDRFDAEPRCKGLCPTITNTLLGRYTTRRSRLSGGLTCRLNKMRVRRIEAHLGFADAELDSRKPRHYFAPTRSSSECIPGLHVFDVLIDGTACHADDRRCDEEGEGGEQRNSVNRVIVNGATRRCLRVGLRRSEHAMFRDKPILDNKILASGAGQAG